MDKLKDEVVTDQSVAYQHKNSVNAVISIILFLVLMAVFYFFG